MSIQLLLRTSVVVWSAAAAVSMWSERSAFTDREEKGGLVSSLQSWSASGCLPHDCSKEQTGSVASAPSRHRALRNFVASLNK